MSNALSSGGWDPGFPPRRIVIPAAVALLGISFTLIAWSRALEGWREQEKLALGALADESRSAIQNRVEQHMDALRDQAKFWQVHGLLSREAWGFEAGMLLEHFTGFSWVAWVDSSGRDVRFLARDSSRALDPAMVADARGRIAHPGPELSPPKGAGQEFQVFLPLRTPDERLGMAVAGLGVDSLLGGSPASGVPRLAYRILTSGGQELFRRGTAASRSAPWLVVRVPFAMSAGESWILEYRPTEDYLALRPDWLSASLWIGILLSLALGALTYQFLRLRDFSSALGLSYQELQERVRQLSERDAELRGANEALEARVVERTRELEEALHDLSTFSASISHDLRSPIAAISNYLLLLQDDYGKDPNLTRTFERIRASVAAATALLDRLTEFKAADLIGAPVRVDMNELVHHAYQEVVVSEPEGREVSFVKHDLPPVEGDPKMLERVFTNLLGNALKYTRGRSQPRVEVGSAGPSADETIYYVSDNGVGFDPTRVGDLFKPFKRLHTEPQFQGVGLGLAITANIVRRHGGRIWAESDGREGATFYLALPRNDRESDAGADGHATARG